MASNSNKAADFSTANFFMKQALRVAQDALNIGEVPVGCVIVLRDGSDDPDLTSVHDNHEDDELMYKSSKSVIISHGANQVNATRDATRHAEMVAIDRMLSKGRSSDLLKLPAEVICKSAHGKIPDSFTSRDDVWVNVSSQKDHWKNGYGWGSGRVYEKEILERCDLYVTCEPCIMVSNLLLDLVRTFCVCAEFSTPRLFSSVQQLSL
jgi:tRNA(Arg) A34 adenosine deaminase TadA